MLRLVRVSVSSELDVDECWEVVMTELRLEDDCDDDFIVMLVCYV